MAVVMLSSNFQKHSSSIFTLLLILLSVLDCQYVYSCLGSGWYSFISSKFDILIYYVFYFVCECVCMRERFEFLCFLACMNSSTAHNASSEEASDKVMRSDTVISVPCCNRSHWNVFGVSIML